MVDFDIKQQVPASSIIEALANKTYKQALIDQENRRQFLQGMTELAQGISTARSRREQIANILAEREALATNPMIQGQVTTPEERVNIIPDTPVTSMRGVGPVLRGQTATPSVSGEMIPNTARPGLVPKTPEEVAALVRSRVGPLVTEPKQGKELFDSLMPVENIIADPSGNVLYRSSTRKGGRVSIAGRGFNNNTVSGKDQFGRTILINKSDGTYSYPALDPNVKGDGVNSSSQTSTQGMPGGPSDALIRLQTLAPERAKRLEKLIDDVYPDNNQPMRLAIEGLGAASQTKKILSDPNPSQVGLNSLGFYFARMSGSNSQLSDAEREVFNSPLQFVDRWKNKGYKQFAGKLSPQMTKDLIALASTIEARSRVQGEKIISSKKRMARLSLGSLYSQGLDSLFPSMEDLSVSSGDIASSSGVSADPIDSFLAGGQ